MRSRAGHRPGRAARWGRARPPPTRPAWWPAPLPGRAPSRSRPARSGPRISRMCCPRSATRPRSRRAAVTQACPPRARTGSLAAIVIAVSLAVVLPVAGTVLALAALALLRAGDLAHSGADQRSPFVTAAAFPFYVVRALLTTALLAPLAITAAVVAGGAAFVLVPTGTLARALSVAAGALVAFYGYGPGSGK